MIKRKSESYSSLSLLKQCPYQYKLRYIDKLYKDKEAIALDIGNICHKVLELQRNPEAICSVDYLLDILQKGYKDNKENISGLEEIKNKFFEEYIKINSKSNLTYSEKLDTFSKYLKEYSIKGNEEDWETIAVEFPFEIKYDDFILVGKIDRIDKNKNGDYKVIDYKTANQVYEHKDLTTPLQMYIYALAIQENFGKYPIEFEYDFVLLGEKRPAMTKGWVKRGQKALDKLVSYRGDYYKEEVFPPCPSPLCYFCDYKGQECEYYSLWTPEEKVYDKVNKEFTPYSKENKESTEFWW